VPDQARTGDAGRADQLGVVHGQLGRCGGELVDGATGGARGVRERRVLRLRRGESRRGVEPGDDVGGRQLAGGRPDTAVGIDADDELTAEHRHAAHLLLVAHCRALAGGIDRGALHQRTGGVPIGVEIAVPIGEVLGHVGRVAGIGRGERTRATEEGDGVVVTADHERRPRRGAELGERSPRRVDRRRRGRRRGDHG
jgi:hypothetical protein